MFSKEDFILKRYLINETQGDGSIVFLKNDPIGHARKDMLPWIVWGNSENDTTKVTERMGSCVQ